MQKGVYQTKALKVVYILLLEFFVQDSTTSGANIATDCQSPENQCYIKFQLFLHRHTQPPRNLIEVIHMGRFQIDETNITGVPCCNAPSIH